MTTIEDVSDEGFQIQNSDSSTQLVNSQFSQLFQSLHHRFEKIQELNQEGINELFSRHSSEDTGNTFLENVALQTAYRYDNIQHSLHQCTREQQENTHKFNNILRRLIEPMIRKSLKGREGQNKYKIEQLEQGFARISFDDMLESSDHILDSRINSCALFQKVQLPVYGEIK